MTRCIMIRARSVLILLLLFLLGPLVTVSAFATVEITPLLNSTVGLRVLNSIPEGARLVERIGGRSGLERLAQQDRWRLDQILQELYFRGSAEDRLAFQLVGRGDETIQFSRQLLARLDQSLVRLRGDPTTPFFDPAAVSRHGSSATYSQSRVSFLTAQPQGPEWGELLRAPFALDDYAQEALSQLSEDGAFFLARRIFARDPPALESLIRPHKLQLASGRSFQLTSRLVISKPQQAYGAAAAAGSSGQSGVLAQTVIARDEVTGNLAGFFILKFEATPSGPRRWEPHLDLIKVDLDQSQVRGLGGAMFDHLVGTVTSLGFPRLLLNADWSGRLVWAKKGFRFDPNYRPQVDGREVTQTALFQENFLRFLKSNQLRIQDLGIQTGADLLPLRRIEQLVEPQDFAQVVALDGRKIVTDQYVDLWRFRENVEAEVGVAFLMKPYFSKIGQRRAVFQPDDSSFVADDAAPSWMGMLELKSKRFENLFKVN